MHLIHMGGDIDMKSTWGREFIFISIITAMTFAIPTSTIAASPVECEAHARSTARSYGGSTLGGAARGAARGALFGAMVGNRKSARRGARIGALAGAARRSINRDQIFRQAYDDCMYGGRY